MNQDDYTYCKNFIDENLSFLNDKEKCCKCGYAFQTLDPTCLLIITQIIAIDIARCTPINQLGVIADVLMGIGQSLVIYTSQQGYMEAGPGRCYDIRNLNIDNPDCTKEESDTSKDMPANNPAINISSLNDNNVL